MGISEAAAALGLSLPQLAQKLDQKELERRVAEDGRVEVLVGLPRGNNFIHATQPTRDDVSVAEGADQSIVSRVSPQVEQMILPMMHALRWNHARDIRRARRAAGIAWAAAAALFLALGAAAAITGNMMLASHDQLRTLADHAQRASDSLQAISAERDQLRGQLAAVNQAAARAQGELTVERKVEDTLFKAALNVRSPRPATSSDPPAMADISR